VNKRDLSVRVVKLIAPFAVKHANKIVAHAKKTPYFHITNKDGTPYMYRWWITKPSAVRGGWSARVHEIVSSDDDRALHDHPWDFYSIILKGSYFEVFKEFDSLEAATSWEWAHPDANLSLRYERETKRYTLGLQRVAGDLNANTPGTFHRIRLEKDTKGREIPATTLFISGPRVNSWGFMVDGKKVPWREYLSDTYGVDHVKATEEKLRQAFGSDTFKPDRTLVTLPRTPADTPAPAIQEEGR
jgi:hypothetical protein